MIGASMATFGILGVTGGGASNATFVALLVFYGVLGYVFAVVTRRSIGTTPWRLPPITWALVSALLPMVGLLLEMVARLTTRHGDSKQSARASFGRPAAMQSPIPDRNYAQGGGNPANPAGGTVPWPARVELREGPGGWRSSPVDGQNGGGTPPPLFGWYPDPDGAHRERYWDGRSWSDLVRDDSGVSSSPMGTTLLPGAAVASVPPEAPRT
ncbi:MAG: DUF2510 domain-containing protein [Acidimicrobiales bacterium]